MNHLTNNNGICEFPYTVAVGMWFDHLNSLMDWFEVPPMTIKFVGNVPYIVIDENDLGCLVALSQDEELLTCALKVNVEDARSITGLDLLERPVR